MSNVVALIPTDMKHTRLGLPSLIGRPLVNRTILEHTVARVARVSQVRKIVLVHPAGQEPDALIGNCDFGTPITTFADPHGLTDPLHAWRIASRKWALGAWRGGLGGSTCYDELLPAKPLVDAMNQNQGRSALIVGADWPLVDPDLCARALELHLSNTEAMKMTFTQAPPGLAGIAIGIELLQQIAEINSTFGRLLAYDPKHPQADAIGLDVCVQIEATVRSCARRFIYDTPRSALLIDTVAHELGSSVDHADARIIANAVHGHGGKLDEAGSLLPQQVTLEVNTQRRVQGPIVPQHHVALAREPMPIEQAITIVEQLGAEEAGQDIALTIGGLGDALLYEPLERLIVAAHQSGVFGIALETDLLVEHAVIDKMLSLPVDILSVRLNADRAKTYEATMQSDRFVQVIQNLEHFLTQRNNAAQNGGTRSGLPWLVPRLIKTEQTRPDMERFFDRWVYYAGHAVIEPATTGRGPDDSHLMPSASPVNMAPPKRIPCRQVLSRMSIHADGAVPRCDQDWLALGAVGHARERPVVELWSELQPVRDSHRAHAWDGLPMCQGCDEWHRP